MWWFIILFFQCYTMSVIHTITGNDHRRNNLRLFSTTKPIDESSEQKSSMVGIGSCGCNGFLINGNRGMCYRGCQSFSNNCYRSVNLNMIEMSSFEEGRVLYRDPFELCGWFKNVDLLKRLSWFANHYASRRNSFSGCFSILRCWGYRKYSGSHVSDVTNKRGTSVSSESDLYLKEKINKYCLSFSFWQATMSESFFCSNLSDSTTSSEKVDELLLIGPALIGAGSGAR